MRLPDKTPGHGKPARPSAQEILAIEEELLRALCQAASGASSSLLEEQLRPLAAYRFRDPTHQIIFETLCELRVRTASGSKAGQETLREHVARHLTLKGFPDVDLELFFRPRSAEQQKEDLGRCILRLTGAHEEEARHDEQ